MQRLTANLSALTLAGFILLGLLSREGVKAAGFGVAFLLVVAVLTWRSTVAKAFLLVWFAMFIVPLLPGLHQTKRTQLLVLSAIAIIGLIAVARAARRPLTSLAWGPAGVLAGLTVADVGLRAYSEVRLINGVQIALTLCLAIYAGQTAQPQDRRRIFLALTAMAEALAVLAIVESLRGAPVFYYSPFQVKSNIDGTPDVEAAFRATGLMPHPLVLCAFLIGVLVMQLARPVGNYPAFARYRVVVVLLLAIGAAATGSRSVVLMVGVGVLAALIARRPMALESRKSFTVGSAVALAVIGFLVLSTGSASLTRRFSDLNSQNEQIRLSGPTVVRGITRGGAVLIGNGPKSVAQAQINGNPLATFGTVDNQFLTAFADYGLIGAAALVVLVLALLLGLRRGALDGWQRLFVIAGFVPVTAMFVFDSLSWTATALLFGFAVGSAWPTLRGGSRRTEVGGLQSAAGAHGDAPVMPGRVLEHDAGRS